jgi:hypothetical protein
MTRLLRKPELLQVKTDITGAPASLLRRGRGDQIVEVYDRWRIADLWWQAEVVREYFMVTTGRGLVCDIYRDMRTNTWYLSRIHD